jgi:hypothetical protein
MNAEQKRAWLGVASGIACVVLHFVRSLAVLIFYGRHVESDHA